MDQPGVDPLAHRQALAGLARINRFSDSVGVFWSVIQEEARKVSRPLRILDIGSGAGDVLLALAKRASRRQVPLELAGCDISSTAVGFARQQAERANAKIDFFTLDVLNDPLPTDYDLLISSLFLHHLETSQAEELLRRMGQATRRTLLINDLARSRMNYFLVWIACHLLSRSPIVHFDGPVSVRAAFTPKEALQLARAAGLDGASVQTKFPCRFLLRWSKMS